MPRSKKATAETVTISREEYEKLQRDRYGNSSLPVGQHIFTPDDEGFEENGGDADYDAGVVVRVLPSGSFIRYNVKPNGWTQEVFNLVIQRGKRPAAGIGSYRQRRLERMKYHKSAAYTDDQKACDELTPAAAMADPLNQWHG